MAQYPTAVKTFSAKSAGDVIQPSHVTDLQDEVTAIEDGLLNGTAPVNSSRITAAALSVAGGSTLATLQVSGASTFTGGIVVPSTARVVCIVTNGGTSQNVASGVSLTGLSFNTEVTDDRGLHSTTTNSSRITFTVLGTYAIHANVSWSASTGGAFRQVRIRANDATDLAIDSRRPLADQGNIGDWQGATTLYTPASTAEYVTLLVAQDSGSTMSVASVRYGVALVGA